MGAPVAGEAWPARCRRGLAQWQCNRAEYIDSDVVFGAKQALITPFTRHESGEASDGTRMDTEFLPSTTS